MDSQILIIALLFALTVAFGIWLSRAGRPYNSLLFNIHKLIALGGVVYCGVTLYQLWAGIDMTALALAVIILTGLLVFGLFVSGALLSIGKPDHAAVLAIHRIALLLVTISGVTAVYLLARQLTVM